MTAFINMKPHSTKTGLCRASRKITFRPSHHPNINLCFVVINTVFICICSICCKPFGRQYEAVGIRWMWCRNRSYTGQYLWAREQADSMGRDGICRQEVTFFGRKSVMWDNRPPALCVSLQASHNTDTNIVKKNPHQWLQQLSDTLSFLWFKSRSCLSRGVSRPYPF